MTEQRKQSQREYDRKNTRTFCIKLNYNTDADLISMLETKDNVQGFIKTLLAKVMFDSTKHLKKYLKED